MMPQGTDDSLRVDQSAAAATCSSTVSVMCSLNQNSNLTNNFARRDASDRPHTLGEGGPSGFPAMADSMSDISDDLDDILGSGLQLMRPAALQADKPGTHISHNLFQGNGRREEQQESNSPSMASSCTLRLECPLLPSRPNLRSCRTCFVRTCGVRARSRADMHIYAQHHVKILFLAQLCAKHTTSPLQRPSGPARWRRRLIGTSSQHTSATSLIDASLRMEGSNCCKFKIESRL
jgi:hypothetical protein